MPPYFFPITNMRDLTKKKKSHIRKKTTGEPVDGILSVLSSFLNSKFSQFYIFIYFGVKMV